MMKIKGERLWRSLMEMAAIGATDGGGNTRLALTEEDRAGRELFISWCRAARLTIGFDAIGNLFAHRAGKSAQAKPVVMGSHLDTQPKGGKYDGVYGVLAALEVIRSLNDADIITENPLEIAVWTNEEGARFTPAMLGSAVFTGALSLEQGLAVTDQQGISVGQVLESLGQRGDLPLRREFDAYYEAHIEQGPVLEDKGISIGVVTGGQGICWLDIDVLGQAAHAGTTPMALRRDAMLGVAEMLGALEEGIQHQFSEGLITIGQLDIPGSSRNTIPGQIRFTVDLRHPDDSILAAMERHVRKVLAQIAEGRRLKLQIQQHWLSPATTFDSHCVTTVRDAVSDLGCAYQDIISGAGHDAINLARHCPTTMIFIPCVGGISHNEAEEALPQDVTQGANVLLNAVLRRAQGA